MRRAGLTRAALWALSIMAAIAAGFAATWAAMALLWLAGGLSPLFWALCGIAVFAYLVLVHLATHWYWDIN
jgi:hypothetical protein